jgi:hypothetical protein
VCARPFSYLTERDCISRKVGHPLEHKAKQQSFEFPLFAWILGINCHAAHALHLAFQEQEKPGRKHAQHAHTGFYPLCPQGTLAGLFDLGGDDYGPLNTIGESQHGVSVRLFDPDALIYLDAVLHYPNSASERQISCNALSVMPHSSAAVSSTWASIAAKLPESLELSGS